jgi:thiamine-phosphate pyrophosphorylase
VPLGRLHVIVNVSAASDPATLLELTTAVVTAGAPVVQLRVKDVTDAVAYGLATAVAGVCGAGGTTLLVNDRVDIAVAVGAGGVHVGDDDLPVAVARRLLGPAATVGATARTANAARRAAAAGATYVGVGPCYPTTTKVVAAAPLGPAGLAVVAGAVDIPVIAIAGVSAQRVPELMAAGAYGVAVVGAVAGAPDPAVATKELLRALGEP